jgi:phosphoribosylformylglycinamidine synthase
MASKGEVGIEIDVERVPLREADMEPFEVMVSESQERMLCVVEPDKLNDVLGLCEKWEVEGAAIGTVTDTGRVHVTAGGELVGDMPVRALVDDCPLYDLQPQKPAQPVYPAPAPSASLPADATLEQTLLALLGSPNIASRRPLFEQYDAIVQSRTVRRPEQADAAVLALPGDGDDSADGDGDGERRRALAVSIDCNGRRVAADPYRGAIESVLECAANLACVGAQPLGTTNNLNFGNPEKPHIAWQLSEAVRGLGEACRALEAPIVGGNVSLYNEGATGPIYPTPVIGMVGMVPDARRAGRLGFARAGDEIALVGPFAPALGASELAKLRGQALPDGLAEFEIEAVHAAQAAVREAVRAGSLSSAHDVAEGGLAVALAECCLAGGLGAEIALGADVIAALGAEGDAETALFGEGPGGFLVSGGAVALQELATRAPLRKLGTVGGDSLALEAAGVGAILVSLGDLEREHGKLAELFP